MKLSKNTTCSLFEIKYPIWNGGKRAVGLAIDRLSRHNEVRILYKRKSDGQRTYPDNYYVDGNIAKVFFKRMKVKSGVELVLVPIGDLQVLERV